MLARSPAVRLGSPFGPGSGESGTGSIRRTDDLGEATYAVMIKPGEEILFGNGRRFLVVDVVPFEEEEESPLVGLLRVEAA